MYEQWNSVLLAVLSMCSSVKCSVRTTWGWNLAQPHVCQCMCEKDNVKSKCFRTAYPGRKYIYRQLLFNTELLKNNHLFLYKNKETTAKQLSPVGIVF